ncbi:MAG: transposase [Chitinophagales bacterium]|nr:transposase [Bacteroidota bacterium]MCB9044160.1 transposase [Chitinophagales bacterium]
MDKYQNKYRIPSARLQNWDYGSNGAYFITICTQNREHFFGDVVNGQMQLNELGQLAEKYWLEIPQHFSFIELGNFVVMPNHTHGILIIDKPANVTETPNVETRLIASLPSPTEIPITTEINGGFSGTKNPMFHNNISRIIRWYKGRCSFEMRKIHADFAWQSRFHDHIIRNAQSFENIQNYVQNNPLKWAEDKFYV